MIALLEMSSFRGQLYAYSANCETEDRKDNNGL